MLTYCCRVERFTPLNQIPGEDVEEVKVGDFCLTSEMSMKGRPIYYVIKVLEVVGDKVEAEWFSFKDEKKLFVKLEAKWMVNKETILSKVNAPVLVGRRERILFKEVFRFLVGREFEVEK